MPDLIRKADVLQWGSKLKDLLSEWMKHSDSPFDKVLNDLTASQKVPECIAKSISAGKSRVVSGDSLESTTLPLFVNLHENDALPAILFNYDRSACETIAKAVMDELKENESAWKNGSSAWKKKLSAWEDWKVSQELLASKKTAVSKAKKQVGKRGEEGGDGDRTTKADLEKDAADSEFSRLATFDPDDPLDQYSFANWKKL